MKRNPSVESSNGHATSSPPGTASVDLDCVDIYSFYSEPTIDVYSALDEGVDSPLAIDC